MGLYKENEQELGVIKSIKQTPLQLESDLDSSGVVLRIAFPCFKSQLVVRLSILPRYSKTITIDRANIDLSQIHRGILLIPCKVFRHTKRFLLYLKNDTFVVGKLQGIFDLTYPFFLFCLVYYLFC